MGRGFTAAMAALLLTGGAVLAADSPTFREGLWSIRNQSVDKPGNRKTDFTSTLCRSHAYDQYVLQLAKSRPGCTVINESMHGSTHTIEMSCTTSGSVVHSRTTVLFQGDSAHSETHATYTPALAGMAETTLIQDQKYLGSCPAGMQPGDMTAADGSVRHLWRH